MARTTVDDILSLQHEPLGQLRSPVAIIALRGQFDAAQVATEAVDRFAPHDAAVTVGEIDPDPLFDFIMERPILEYDDDGNRVVKWPGTTIDVVRDQGGRDLVILVGVEPHFKINTYAAAVTAAVQRLGCQAVVTVGAHFDAVPHTRLPVVVGSSSNTDLASKLGLSKPSYQGPTGPIGVLHSVLADVDLPSISLRVSVPPYLASSEHPMAIKSIHTHLSHVLGVPSAEPDMSAEIAHWRSVHDDIVATSTAIGTDELYALEQYYDQTVLNVPDSEELGTRFEEFLRDHGTDETE